MLETEDVGRCSCEDKRLKARPPSGAKLNFNPLEWRSGPLPTTSYSACPSQGRQCPRSKKPQLPTRLKPCLSCKDLNLNSRGLGMEKRLLDHKTFWQHTFFQRNEAVRPVQRKEQNYFIVLSFPPLKSDCGISEKTPSEDNNLNQMPKNSTVSLAGEKFCSSLQSSAEGPRDRHCLPDLVSARLAGCQILKGSLRQRKKIKP